MKTRSFSGWNLKCKKRPLIATAISALVLLTAGCANMNSIYRDKSLSTTKPNLVLVDSKQRAIVASPNDTDGEAMLRLCSEPSPDVFSALASSLAAEASASEAGDIAASLSASISEQASTIERTQTINMLRESMFRTCERYLSGAIGRTEFIVQAARDQRAMVAILAIEQLTGVQKSQATALTTVAKSSAGGVSNDSIATMEKARTNSETAKAAAVAKRAEADASEPADVNCETAVASEDQAHAAKKKACEEASALEKKAADAEAYFKLVKQSVERLGGLDTSASGQITTAALSGAAASEQLAKHVVEIVKDVGQFDEIGMTCVIIFRLMADGKMDASISNELREACIGRVSAEARLTAAQMQEREQEIQSRLNLMREATEKAGETVWNAIQSDGTPDSDKLDALIKKARDNSTSGLVLLGSQKEALLAAPDLDTFLRAFTNLFTSTQQALSDNVE